MTLSGLIVRLAKQQLRFNVRMPFMLVWLENNCSRICQYFLPLKTQLILLQTVSMGGLIITGRFGTELIYDLINPLVKDARPKRDHAGYSLPMFFECIRLTFRPAVFQIIV